MGCECVSCVLSGVVTCWLALWWRASHAQSSRHCSLSSSLSCLYGAPLTLRTRPTRSKRCSSLCAVCVVVPHMGTRVRCCCASCPLTWRQAASTARAHTIQIQIQKYKNTKASSVVCLRATALLHASREESCNPVVVVSAEKPVPHL